jgi:hypothetical protein
VELKVVLTAKEVVLETKNRLTTLGQPVEFFGLFSEREKGFEPSTSTLANSTPSGQPNAI